MISNENGLTAIYFVTNNDDKKYILPTYTKGDVSIPQ
jgi:hypothetical protein